MNGESFVEKSILYYLLDSKFSYDTEDINFNNTVNSLVRFTSIRK